MDIQTQPRLRPDLLITEQEEGRQSVYILKDPVTGRFFRLKRLEYQIASLFDGTVSIQQALEVLRQQYSINLTEETLIQFLDKLASNHLVEIEHDSTVENPPADSSSANEANPRTQRKKFHAYASASGSRRKSRISRLLYWKIASFDPDEFFNRIIPWVRFLYTKIFFWIAISTIVFALGITLNNWDEIARQVSLLFSVHSVIFAFVVMMPIVVFHEMAHGMTCKYFGGEVHEMGVLFLYFQPACYCNVSDSYLFKQRRQRIWVMVAGVFIQSFLWAVLTVLWRILAPETWLAQGVFITIAVTGVITLFQFNPLLRLDGYYILAELFAVRNLRSKSFGYLRTKAQSLLTGASNTLNSLSRRERRIYWAYGLMALIYSVNFLGYFILKAERFLVEKYQGAGFILFWGLALGVVSEPLIHSVGKIFPKNVLEGKHTMVRHKNIYATSFLCVTGILILTMGRWELKVSDPCVLIPYERAEVRAEVAGTIDQIYFDEGQTVHAGDVIARLADYQYNGEKAKILAQISEAQSQLQLMIAGPSKQDIALSQSQIDSADAAVKKAEAQIPIAKEQVDYATKNYERSKKMYDEKLLASMSLDQASRDMNLRQRELIGVQHDVEEKRQQLQEAKRSLAKVVAGSRPEEIDAKRAEIEGLVAQEKQLEVESSYTAIRSPIDGVITTHFLKQKEKSYLQQGDVVCQVANTKKIITEIPVPEKEVGDVKIGYPVKLKANAYPNREFDGRVTQISDIADQGSQDVRVVMVRSEVDNPHLLLKPQMTGYAKIYCGKRTIGDLMSRRMVRFIRTEFWSWF